MSSPPLTMSNGKGGLSPALTIAELQHYVAPTLGDPLWPADVFAVAASILAHSGAYTVCIESWPPAGFVDLKQWTTHIKKLGAEWRRRAAAGQPPPDDVAKSWALLEDRADLELSQLSNSRPVCDALLQLIAAADEACTGLGVAFRCSEKTDEFREDSEALLLVEKGSLCRDIDPSRVRVLPKMHTPQQGITLRSLTHNLALCEGRGVKPSWHKVPLGSQRGSLNLLVVPWPKVVRPNQFAVVQGSLGMPDAHGFFAYTPAENVDHTLPDLVRVYNAAIRTVGRVDGVILPELAVTEAQYVALRDQVLARQSFLVTGFAGRRKDGYGLNCLAMDFPRPDKTVLSIGPQHKHHRWRLDKAQILQYGLGSVLDHTACLWEHIPVGERTLAFVALNDRLTLTALICEDLARQDPVSDAVRAVGPNLIIALLMDGPQLNTRWPARYATVLADDPGSSVLTITSLGMAALSCPRDKSPSRAIALWKDAHTGAPRELAMPDSADALVLSIVLDAMQEWTADGRGDGGVTGFPILAGVFPISKHDKEPSPFTVAAGPTEEDSDATVGQGVHAPSPS